MRITYSKLILSQPLIDKRNIVKSEHESTKKEERKREASKK